MAPICEVDQTTEDVGKQKIAALLWKLCPMGMTGVSHELIPDALKPPEVSGQQKIQIAGQDVDVETIVTHGWKPTGYRNGDHQLSNWIPEVGRGLDADHLLLLSLFGIDTLFSFKCEIVPSPFTPKTKMRLGRLPKELIFDNYKHTPRAFPKLRETVAALAMLPDAVLKRFIGRQNEQPFYLFMLPLEEEGLPPTSPSLESLEVARVSPTKDKYLVEDIVGDEAKKRLLERPDAPIVLFRSY